MMVLYRNTNVTIERLESKREVTYLVATVKYLCWEQV